MLLFSILLFAESEILNGDWLILLPMEAQVSAYAFASTSPSLSPQTRVSQIQHIQGRGARWLNLQ